MRSCGNTDVGLKRNTNQDYLFCSDEPVGAFPNLYIVADGMGGHRAGDHASHMAVDRFVQLAEQTKQTNPVTLMRTLLSWVNEEIYQEAMSDEAYYGMGTTFVAITVINGMGYVLNVGDSRLYKISNYEIKQVTLDHSMVEELVRSGDLTPQEARRHPRRNIITRAVGVGETVLPDFFEIELSKGDQILLCSDGLSNMIQDDELLSIVTSDKNIDDKVRYLIDRANYYGGYDNIAAVLVVNEE
ncbi:MAG: Stp1/IreP family PP2C-type Ser/Thr phosphatase [Lachnospiraceae bacterium]|nr:Stp1/IreP family PP2C-type Ser/Thr phosphatase [Lachnospiraceae bacterium]